MGRRKLFIAGTIALAAIVLVVVVVIVGGIWLLRSRSKAAAPARTAVGTPKGSATTKTIGPAGGSISSPDGRITVEVPPKAVSDSLNFSIQSITNMAPNGSGDAYRLEPSGRDFSMPVKLSFRISDAEIAAKTPDVFGIAWQDAAGAWRSLTPDIANDNKIYSISTTHFSDWSFITFTDPGELKRLRQLHIDPKVQTIRPGKTTYVELVGCKELDRLTDKIGRIFAYNDVGCGGFTFYGGYNSKGYQDPLNWNTDVGTIETGKYKVKYTAPVMAQPKIATVRLPVETTDLKLKTDMSARIYIEPAYKVSGQNGPMVYSGTICSLEKPFKITVTHPLISYEINFTPSESDVVFKPNKVFHTSISPPYMTGLFTYTVTRGLLHMSGNGTYYLINLPGTTIGPTPVASIADGRNPEIVCNEFSEAHGPMHIGSSGKGFARIQLSPLDTKECDGK